MKATGTAMRANASGSKVMRQALAGLTAAAEVLNDNGKAGVNGGRGNQTATRTWQHAVTTYGHIVPELSAGKMYVGNCMARISLRVGARDTDGTVEAIDADSDDANEGPSKEIVAMAQEVISSIRSQIGGQSELLRSYGEKAFTVGEAFLLPEDTPAGLAFEVLSTQELVREGTGWVIHNGPGTDPEPVPENIEPVRVWRPDDVYRKQATSSVRACLEVLEELVLLTKLVRSSAISRMALAGILAIAEEFDDDENEGEDNGEQANPLLVDIILNGAKAIDDPASAASWLPYLLSGPKELIQDGIKFIEFKHDDAINVVKRREALERLAQGLDLPFEVILGHQGTTFSNAQVISEDTFRVHLEPMVQLFCDAVTLGILWPGLAAKMQVDSEDVRKNGYPPEILQVAVTYDASDLISVPDKAREIAELFVKDVTQMGVKISEVRDAMGLDPDGRPDDDEVAARLDAYRIAHIRETVQAPVSDAASLTGTITGPIAAEGAGVTASLYLAEGLAHRIAGAAEITMERCAEKIGSKVRQRLKGEQLAAVGQQPNSEVSRTLGPTVVRNLLNGDDPTRVEIGTFERTVAKWAADAGQRNPGQLAKAVGMMMEASIADRLYSGQPSNIDIEALDALAAV